MVDLSVLGKAGNGAVLRKKTNVFSYAVAKLVADIPVSYLEKDVHHASGIGSEYQNGQVQQKATVALI